MIKKGKEEAIGLGEYLSQKMNKKIDHEFSKISEGFWKNASEAAMKMFALKAKGILLYGIKFLTCIMFQI